MGGGESWELQSLMGGSGKFYCDTIQNPLTFLPPTPHPHSPLLFFHSSLSLTRDCIKSPQNMLKSLL